MKDENVIKDKSFAFAIRIVKLYNYLTNEKKEYVLSKQILRSGTSIGANIREAVVGRQHPCLSRNSTLPSAKPTRQIIGLIY